MYKNDNFVKRDGMNLPIEVQTLNCAISINQRIKRYRLALFPRFTPLIRYNVEGRNGPANWS